MLWLILVLITATIWAIAAFFDNYITDVVFKNKRPQSMKVFNGAGYLIAALIIAFFYQNLTIPNLQTIVLMMLSGALAGLASIPYYSGLQTEEATGAAIFYQLQPVLYLLAGVLFFGEEIIPIHILALILIMSAPLVIIFSRRQKKARRRELKSAIQFLLYVILLVASGVIFTQYCKNSDYLTCFMFFLFGRGLADTSASILNKKWMADFRDVWKKKKWLFLKTAGVNQLLCIIAEFTSRRSLMLGDRSITSAITNSLELILTFAFGIILTIHWPKFGREELHKPVIIAHLIGVVLCIVGIVILNLTGASS